MVISLNYLFTVFLLLLPIVDVYSFFSFDLFYIFGLFGLLLFIVYGRRSKTQIKSLYFIYLIYVLIVSAYAVISLNMGLVSYIIRMVRFVFLFVIFFLLTDKAIDYKRFVFLYTLFCSIFSILVLSQYVSSYLGAPFTLLLPDMLVNGTISSNDYIESQLLNNRFSSVFLEPAHQAQYMLPGLCIVLFNNDQISRRDILLSLLITSGLFATTSMQGIVGGIMIWLLYLIKSTFSRSKRQFRFLLASFPIICIIVWIFWNQPIIQEQIIKKASSLYGTHVVKGTSMYFRLFIGFDCFKDLPYLNKLFGTGYGYSYFYLLQSGIGYNHYYNDLFLMGYMNGISKMLFEIGLLGTVLFLIIVVINIKDYLSDALVISGSIVFVFIMLTCDSYEQLSMYLPLAVLFARVSYLKKSLDNNQSLIDVGVV